MNISVSSTTPLLNTTLFLCFQISDTIVIYIPLHIFFVGFLPTPYQVKIHKVTRRTNGPNWLNTNPTIPLPYLLCNHTFEENMLHCLFYTIIEHKLLSNTIYLLTKLSLVRSSPSKTLHQHTKVGPIALIFQIFLNQGPPKDGSDSFKTL